MKVLTPRRLKTEYEKVFIIPVSPAAHFTRQYIGTDFEADDDGLTAASSFRTPAVVMFSDTTSKLALPRLSNMAQMKAFMVSGTKSQPSGSNINIVNTPLVFKSIEI
jgi:hypothetical protein